MTFTEQTALLDDVRDGKMQRRKTSRERGRRAVQAHHLLFITVLS